MIEVNFNKIKQALVIKIEIQPPEKDGDRTLMKRERISRAFQMADDELKKAWQLATQDNEALDKELAEKAAEIALRKSKKIEVDLDA